MYFNKLKVTKVTDLHNLVTCNYDMPNPDNIIIILLSVCTYIVICKKFNRILNQTLILV